MLFNILIILSCIAGLLLIGAVLIQPGKGDLASGMGGIGGQFGSMIGMRRTADLIVKITISLAIIIMVFALAANTVFRPDRESGTSTQMQGMEAPAGQPPPPVSTPAPSAQPAQPNQQPASPAPASK